MARRKAAKNCALSPWLSAKGDCREGRFIQVGNSLLLSTRFQVLSAGAKHLYLCMAMEAGGRRSFKLPHSAAAKKYGVPSRSFDRYVAELVSAGFIKKDSGKTTRTPNEYLFLLDWKGQASQNYILGNI